MTENLSSNVVSASMQQVQEREEKDSQKIDQMPVRRTRFEQRQFRIVRADQRQSIEEENERDEPNNKMNHVHARHDVIEHEEVSGRQQGHPSHFRVVLKDLDDDEGEPAEDCAAQQQ